MSYIPDPDMSNDITGYGEKSETSKAQDVSD